MEDLREDAVARGVKRGTALPFGSPGSGRLLSIGTIGSEATLGDGALGGGVRSWCGIHDGNGCADVNRSGRAGDGIGHFGLWWFGERGLGWS
jgi:hypothetical protein